MAGAKRDTTRGMFMSRDAKRNRFWGVLTVGVLLGIGCVEQSREPQVSDEDVQAARAGLPKESPTPRYPSQAMLQNPGGGKIAYLGMDIDTDSIAAGKSFTITHYFRVEQPAPDGWRLFVHLDSPDKRGHLTADHVPVGGKYPVPRWQAGEIISDSHKVMLPPSWPGNKLQIFVGLWKGQQRFAVSGGRADGQNRVLAAELPVQGGAPPPSPKRMIVRKLKAGTTLTIDGKLDEPAWKEASTTGPFVGTMDGSPAKQQSSARVLWDDKNLYVAFEFQDTDIWSTLEKHDDKLWTQEAAEMFIDADGDGKTYVELQVNPRNVTFDSWLPTYRANDNAWDAPLLTAVQVSGTLDNRDDTDTGWTVEMQIPLTVAKGRLAEMRGVPPVVGTMWRANFFRMDQAKSKPQMGSAWSPPLVGDFHALDRFGVLHFGDEQGLMPPPPAPAPAPAAVPAQPAGGELPPALQRSMLKNPTSPPPTHPEPGSAASPASPGSPGAKPAPAKPAKK